MKFVKPLFFVIFSIVIFPLASLGQEGSQVEHQADSLYEQHDEEEALELYERILEQDSTNYKALWRTSFLYSRIGNRLENEDDQRAYFDQAIDLAEQAVSVDSMDSQSNFVMSVAMGRKALISGAKDRVAASRAIKKYVGRAIEYDSTNAGAWHVLGRWHLKVANLSWVERLAANTLFGGLPGDASNEKAVESIEKAIDLNDQYILYYYDLAQAYKESGRDKQAIEICQQAIGLPLLTLDDSELKEKCRKLIQDI